MMRECDVIMYTVNAWSGGSERVTLVPRQGVVLSKWQHISLPTLPVINRNYHRRQKIVKFWVKRFVIVDM